MSERDQFEQWLKENGAPDENNMFSELIKGCMYHAWIGAKEKYEQRWISVDNDEDLPEEDIDVLCLCEDGTIVVASHHNSFFTDDRWCLLAATHWTPLPSAHRDQGE